MMTQARMERVVAAAQFKLRGDRIQDIALKLDVTYQTANAYLKCARSNGLLPETNRSPQNEFTRDKLNAMMKRANIGLGAMGDAVRSLDQEQAEFIVDTLYRDQYATFAELVTELMRDFHAVEMQKIIDAKRRGAS